jgi:hypothetical protein
MTYRLLITIYRTLYFILEIRQNKIREYFYFVFDYLMLDFKKKLYTNIYVISTISIN